VVRQAMPGMKVRSLTTRVLTIATIWAAIALLVLAVIISTLYRQGTERGFKEVLRAQLYNVINSVTINASGQLEGNPQFGDLRFAQPQTGWYYIVDPINNEAAERLASVSLGGETLPVVDLSTVPFDTFYERFYEITDPFGNGILVAETEVVLDDEGRAARFRLTGNKDAVEADVADFTQTMAFAFVVFGLGSLLANAAAILFGLRPLDSVRRSLESVRNGESASLEGEFPREIEPLAGEVNALIQSNHRVVERARMQVGNLAHSLKTPIAVLLNEARTMNPDHASLVASQAEAMRCQVQSYLDRARIAAQVGSVLARTDARAALDRLLRVMRRLNPALTFTARVDPPHVLFAVEQQDLEEIAGNLLDNASRFATTTVRLAVEPCAKPALAGIVDREDATATPNQGEWLCLTVEDDGPGLSRDEIVEAMKRGRRLDESTPGTGLGLSIVLVTAREYGGDVALDRSGLGGLRAQVWLPRAAQAGRNIP
jgi:signal transduction histidine kinase